jgi:hypothetical protein
MITCVFLHKKSPQRGGPEYLYKMPVFAQVIMVLDVVFPPSGQ